MAYPNIVERIRGLPTVQDEPEIADPNAPSDAIPSGMIRAAANQAAGIVQNPTPEMVARQQLAADNEAAIAAVQQQRSAAAPTGMDQAGLMAEVGNSYQGDALRRGQLLSETRTVSTPNQMHAPVQDFARETRAATQQGARAMTEGQDVAMSAADRYVAAATDEWARLSGEADAADAVQAQRSAKLTEQQNAVKDARLAQTAANDRVANAPPEDAGRFWADQSMWKKFAYAISAALLGAGGSDDPFRYIDAAIQGDIQAQRANLGQLQSVAQLKGNEVSSQQNVYAQILETVGDERAADLILQNARFKEAEARMQQIAATTQRDALSPAFMEAQAQMRARIAQGELELDRLAASNPAYFRKTVPKISGPARRVQEKLFDYDLKRAAAGEDAAYDTAREVVKEGGKAELDRGKHDLEERKFQAQQREKLTGGEKGGAVETALQLTKDYLADYAEDVPGRTEGGLGGDAWFREPSFWKSEAGQRETKQRDLLSQWYATALTGANVSTSQEEFLNRLARDNDMSGDEIRAGLGDLQRSLEIYQQTTQRAVEPEAEAAYRGVDESMLPARDAKTGGRTRSNTGVESEASRLGGTLK